MAAAVLSSAMLVGLAVGSACDGAQAAKARVARLKNVMSLKAFFMVLLGMFASKNA
jgi:hypothetical protein